jgi:hypothetical protein
MTDRQLCEHISRAFGPIRFILRDNLQHIVGHCTKLLLKETEQSPMVALLQSLDGGGAILLGKHAIAGGCRNLLRKAGGSLSVLVQDGMRQPEPRTGDRHRRRRSLNRGRPYDFTRRLFFFGLLQ